MTTSSHIHNSKHVNPKTGIVIAFLIIIISYLAPLISIASGTDYAKYVNYLYLYTTISYTIIILSIIIFPPNITIMFQDHFSLWAVVATCFFRASLGGIHEVVYRGILFFLGILLAIHIIKNRKTYKMPTMGSFFTGILWSACTIILIVLFSLFLEPKHGSPPSSLSAYIINAFIFQISFVTVIEEAYFRGLIVGLMVMNGYKESTAFLAQAVLFWGMHYMKFSHPALFFVTIPIFTLSTTLIIKKYKMLYLSIMMHTLHNVFSAVLVAFL